MTAPTLRIGVLGCGAVACTEHLPALRSLRGAVVSAVADPDPAARARAAALAPGAAVHEDAGELLRRTDVDAAIVTAPPRLHAELAAAAARAGKHVYVEKPLTVGEAEAERLVADLARAGVTAAVGFNRRAHPAYVRARELLDAGCIGEVRFVRTAFCEPLDTVSAPPWKRRRADGGGVLLDLASHHFDLVRWLLRDEVRVVHASLRPGWSDEDEALVELATDGGVDVQSLFSFRAAHADAIELFGEAGRLRVDRHRGALVLHRRRRARYGVRRAWLAVARNELVRHARRGDPSFRLSLAAFASRATGAPAETASLEDGLRSLQAVLAAQRAAR